MANAHVMPIEIGFKHCDPAGIVFYPRYVEMFNDTVEHWLKYGVGKGFGELHGRRKMGLPIVNLEADFSSPSRLGEVLQGELRVTSLGRTSLKVAITLRGSESEDNIRVQARLVLVFMSLETMRPVEIPADVREAITAGYLSN